MTSIIIAEPVREIRIVKKSGRFNRVGRGVGGLLVVGGQILLVVPRLAPEVGGKV
jgi:hypothetical protein